jgi:type II secretory pathway pseudopilin PulG
MTMNIFRKISGRARPLVTKNHRQDGNALLASMLGIVILGVITVAAMPSLTNQLRAPARLSAAEHMNMVAAAADQYAKDNMAEITSSLTLNGPAVSIPLSALRNLNYLSSNVPDVNSYGQGYMVYFRREQAGNGATAQTFNDRVVVTTGGTQIPETDIRSAAARIEAGGYQSSQRAGVIQGVQGKYEIANTTFGIPFEAGHLASARFYNDAGVLMDFLYRVPVEGRPEANRMATDLEGGTADTLNADGTIASKGTQYNAKNFNSVQARTVTPTVVAVSGQPCTQDAAGNALTDVGPGSIAKDEAGKILSCQDGVWLNGDINWESTSVYGRAQNGNFVITTPASYKFCALSMSGNSNGGRCVVSRNANGTWKIDGASSGGSDFSWCQMTCYN